MSKRYGMLVVEGPHDRAFVCRTLECMGFKRFDGKEPGLDDTWKHWKPEYPKNKRLYDPLDMPSILDTDTWSIAVMVAGGSEVRSPKKGFGLRLRNKPAFMAAMKLDGAFGFILDADDKVPNALVKGLRDIYLDNWPHFPGEAGMVAPGQPRVGCFVLPNNIDPGTIENVLVPLGQTNHGKLLGHAHRFVDGCEPELKTHFKPFDRLKSIVATAASILQPGATNTVIIESDKWITANHLDHPVLTPFVAFLRDLLELPNPPQEAERAT